MGEFIEKCSHLCKKPDYSQYFNDAHKSVAITVSSLLNAVMHEPNVFVLYRLIIHTSKQSHCPHKS